MLRQGNVFTPVCHSVHGGVSGRQPPVRHLPSGLTPPPCRQTPRQIPPRQTPSSWVDTPLCRQTPSWAGRSLGQTPPSRHHPQADTTAQADTTLPGRHHPKGRHPPGQILPWADTPTPPPTWQMAIAADGTHFTGMHSCDK